MVLLEAGSSIAQPEQSGDNIRASYQLQSCRGSGSGISWLHSTPPQRTYLGTESTGRSSFFRRRITKGKLERALTRPPAPSSGGGIRFPALWESNSGSIQPHASSPHSGSPCWRGSWEAAERLTRQVRGPSPTGPADGDETDDQMKRILLLSVSSNLLPIPIQFQFRRRRSWYRMSSIREVIKRGKHALLDIPPTGIDRLNYSQLYRSSSSWERTRSRSSEMRIGMGVESEEFTKTLDMCQKTERASVTSSLSRSTDEYWHVV